MTMTTAAQPARPRRRRRPFALIALAGLLLFKAGLAMMVLLGVGIGASGLPSDIMRLNPEMGAMIAATSLSQAILIAVAVLLVIAAGGLLALQRRGWLIAMVATGVFVGFDIIAFTAGSANYLWMALNIATVFYLNQTDVREVVGVSTESLVPNVGLS
jgi:uncharacterized membrane protein (DUF2068 family)